jgi:hypothetical protein
MRLIEGQAGTTWRRRPWARPRLVSRPGRPLASPTPKADLAQYVQTVHIHHVALPIDTY